MEDKDYIKDLFADKLSHQTAPVKPELWQAVSSALPASGAVATGLSLTAKWLIGIGLSGALGAGTWFVVNQIDAKQEQTAIRQEQQTSSSNEEVAAITSITAPETNQELQNQTPAAVQEATETRESVYSDPEEQTALFWVDPHENVTQPEPIAEPALITEPEAKPGQQPTPERIEPAKPGTPANDAQAGNKQDQAIRKIPNVLSPNRDGVNDVFEIETEGLSDFSFIIMNQQGERVFVATDPKFKWDGTQNDEAVPDGDYIYYLLAVGPDGQPVKKSGTISVIRK